MKRLFFVLLGILLFICAADAALDFFYVAGPAKRHLESYLSEKIGATVEMERLRFRLARGFTLKNLVIRAPQAAESGDGLPPLLAVKKADLKVRYLPLLAKKWVIESATLVEPRLHLARDRRGNWVFPRTEGSGKAPLLERIRIRDGEIALSDGIIPGAAPFRLAGIRCDGRVGLVDGIRLNFFGAVPGAKDGETGTVEADARIRLPSLDVEARGQVKQFPLELLNPYLQRKIHDLKTLAGKADGSFGLSGGKGRPLAIRTSFSIPAFKWDMTPLQIAGRISLESRWSYLAAEDAWTYKGEVEFQDSILAASALPSAVTAIRGQFLFENDFLATNGVEGIYEGSSVRARGTLENFRRPRTHATLFTDVAPEKIWNLAGLFIPEPARRVRIEGKSFTQVELHTNEETGKLAWKGKIYLRDARFAAAGAPLALQQVQGSVAFSPAEASGELHFAGGSARFSWNPTQPSFHLLSSGKEFSLLAEGTWNEETLTLTRLQAYGFGATLDLTGTAALMGSKETRLSGEAKADTRLLQKNWPVLWEKTAWLREWAPDGVFDLKGKAQGNPGEPDTWKIAAAVRGKNVGVKQVPFDEFQMDFRRDGSRLHFDHIRGAVGPGLLTGQAAVAATPEAKTYSFEFKWRDMPLVRLPQQKRKPDEPLLRGNLEGGISMSGVPDKPETASGVAYFKVTDGELRDAPVVKPIWKVVRHVAPRLERPILHSASADFVIKDGAFHTDNMELVGPGIILSPSGKIGLDEKVDMKVKIKFFKPEGENLKTLAMEGLNLLGKLVEVRYRGTLSKPKVDTDWLPALEKLVNG